MTLNFSNNKTYIIAEIGVNHNGKIGLAKKLIKEAKKSGADAVKFQSFKTSAVVTKFANQAPYQKKNLKIKEKQFDMLKRYELKNEDYYILNNECKKLKIDFISSVFDEDSVDFIKNKIKSKIFKLPSGEINNYLILRKLKLTNYKILISTGMSNYKEIAQSINTIGKEKIFKIIGDKVKIVNKKLFKKVKKQVCVMHCVTDYPVVKTQANLKCIDSIKKDFDLSVGYSDHTLGIIAPIIAVSKGACVIEKHFTLDTKMKGPDHLASLEPKEFKPNCKEFRLRSWFVKTKNEYLTKYANAQLNSPKSNGINFMPLGRDFYYSSPCLHLDVNITYNGTEIIYFNIENNIPEKMPSKFLTNESIDDIMNNKTFGKDRGTIVRK